MVYEDTLAKAKQQLSKIPGVIGVGLTHSIITSIGNEYQIVVYIKDESVTKLLPHSIDNLQIVYKISSKAQIHAFAYTNNALKKIQNVQMQSAQVQKNKSLQPYNPYNPYNFNPHNINAYNTNPYSDAYLQSLTFTQKYRPISGGISGGLAGQQMSSTGTLGCFVLDNTNKVVILSNNHVLAWNIAGFAQKGMIGDPVVQPGLVDYGTVNDSIATLQKFVTVNATGNTIDAAYAVPTTTSIKEPNICNLYTNKSTTPVIGMNVTKGGRTTGCVTGQVEAVGVSFDITYTLHASSGDINFVASFNDLISISNATTPVSEPGDSGSMWVTNDTNNNAVALNFAGDDAGTSISCTATNIENALGVKFGTTSFIAPTSCSTVSVNLSI